MTNDKKRLIRPAVIFLTTMLVGGAALILAGTATAAYQEGCTEYGYPPHSRTCCWYHSNGSMYCQDQIRVCQSNNGGCTWQDAGDIYHPNGGPCASIEHVHTPPPEMTPLPTTP